MTRPSEVTRDRIMKAAERLFAERGYDGTSIRAIVAKARVNQAAINYHFDGKDGLYREVLRTAFRGMTEDQLSHAQDMKTMSREEALGEFIRRQLRPLDGARRIQPPHADLQLGNGAADAGLPQPARRGGGTLHGRGGRSGAPFHARRRPPHADRRFDLADRPMRRVPAQSRPARRAPDRARNSTTPWSNGWPSRSAAGLWPAWAVLGPSGG